MQPGLVTFVMEARTNVAGGGMTGSVGQDQEAAGRPGAPLGMRRRKARPAPSVNRGWGWRYPLVACALVLVLDFVLARTLPAAALRIGVGSLTLDAGMLIALVPLYRRRRFRAVDLGLRPTSGARAVGLTFGALVTYFAVAAIWALAVLGRQRHQITPQLHASTAGKVVAGVALCLAAPVVEELFFRGFLYRALRNRLTVTWSVLIVAILFAAGHASTYPVDTLPIKAVFGAIACLLYERTGSLYPGIALHCLVDSSGFEASVSHGEIWIVAVAFLALGLAVLVRHRFRAPTESELAAFGGRPGVSTSDHAAQGGWKPRSAEPSGRFTEALAVRVGAHSPRRVLAAVGMLLVAGSFLVTLVITISDPGRQVGHSGLGAVLGMFVIIGLLMIITAILWRLFRRPPHR